MTTTIEPAKIKPTRIEPKMLLSTLWIFILFNMLFRDVHEMATREFLEEALTGIMNGTVITDELMLIGGIMVEILIIMVLLSRILPYRLNRWTNIGVGILVMVLLWMNTTAPDLDDIFFAAVESVALVFIIGVAWRWKQQEA
ncbi:MAG: DUF6326 family protein [Chloroflexota bacterium]